MTSSEFLAIAICLFVGYWVVSKALSKPKAAKQTRDSSESGSEFRRDRHDDRSANEQGAESRAQEESRRPEPEWQNEFPHWADILGTHQNASRDEIRKAYRQRMSEYHPDKVAQLGKELREVAERKSKEINAAYDFIMKQKGF